MFAKLYTQEEHGQILVKLDVNEKGQPEVRTYFEPKGLGVCSLATTFKDDDKGWFDSSAYFEKYTMDDGAKIIETVLIQLGITPIEAIEKE